MKVVFSTVQIGIEDFLTATLYTQCQEGTWVGIATASSAIGPAARSHLRKAHLADLFRQFRTSRRFPQFL